MIYTINDLKVAFYSKEDANTVINALLGSGIKKLFKKDGNYTVKAIRFAMDYIQNMDHLNVLEGSDLIYHSKGTWANSNVEVIEVDF